jgi:AcrR family transcriptional regulator
VREIARDCGLSQAGLLHHFSSKEELFLEVLRRRDGRREATEPVGHSVATLIDVVRRNVDEPGLARLFVAMSAESTDDESPAKEFFASRYARLTDDLAADVARQHRRDDLDASDIGKLLVAAADGLQLQWLLEPERAGMAPLLSDLWHVLRSPSED